MKQFEKNLVYLFESMFIFWRFFSFLNEILNCVFQTGYWIEWTLNLFWLNNQNVLNRALFFDIVQRVFQAKRAPGASRSHTVPLHACRRWCFLFNSNCETKSFPRISAKSLSKIIKGLQPSCVVVRKRRL